MEAADRNRIMAAFRGQESSRLLPLVRQFEGDTDPFVTISTDEGPTDPDAVLWEMPDTGDGLELFVNLREKMPTVPIVVIGRSEDDSLAVKLVRAGAQDCIFEPDPDRGRLRRALCFAANRFAMPFSTLRRERCWLPAPAIRLFSSGGRIGHPARSSGRPA
jgi:CheY-like chemotaxis protein